MSDNYNIRDFRSTPEPETKSERKFWAFAIAVPMIAAVAGLGYQPLLEIRNGNVEAAAEGQRAAVQAFRAENPELAFFANMRSDKIIDLNVSSARTPDQIAQQKAQNKALNADEFLQMVDAKANGFTKAELRTLKYERAKWALRTCRHSDLNAFYGRQNDSKYERIKATETVLRVAQSENRVAEIPNLELPDIETKTQALAFVASGGARRHQEASMNIFAGLANLGVEGEKFKIRARKQRFNKTGCARVRTIVQSGSLHLK